MKHSLIGTCLLFSALVYAEASPVQIDFEQTIGSDAAVKSYTIEEAQKEREVPDRVFNRGKELKYTALDHSIKSVSLKTIESDHQKMLVIEIDYRPLKKNGKKRHAKLQYCLTCIH